MSEHTVLPFCLIALCTAPYELGMQAFPANLLSFRLFLPGGKQVHVVDLLGLVFLLGAVFCLSLDELVMNRTLVVGPQLVSRQVNKQASKQASKQTQSHPPPAPLGKVSVT